MTTVKARKSSTGKVLAGVVTVTILAVSAGEPGAVEIPTPGQVINIVHWDADRLPPVYERSAQPPLSLADIEALTEGGFTPEALVRMVQERSYAGDASASGLIALANRGIDPTVLQAVSLHALPPNRSIRMTVELHFEGASREARKRYLYVIVPDGSHDRVLTADLGAVISGSWRRDTLVDHSDQILPKQIRTVSFTDELPLRSPGRKDVIVLTSARPDIRRIQDIPVIERADIRRFVMDYPPTSIVQNCRIWIRYKQDPALPHKWEMTAADLECEWD